MYWVKKLKASVDHALGWFAISISCVLVVCVVWQVFARYVLGSSSTSTDEIARFMLMWVGLIGAAYATGQKKHLSIDLLTQGLSDYRKKVSDLTIAILVILFVCIVMLYGGTNLVINTLASKQTTPALGIPMGYVYISIPFSGCLILFYTFLDLVTLVFSKDGAA